jgi:hypothetical protein
MTQEGGLASDLVVGRNRLSAGAVLAGAVFGLVVRGIAMAGTITTVAGTGTWGYNGDGIPATSAMLNIPYGVDANAVGDLFIADEWNQLVRKVSASTGLISTVAGTAETYGYNGDGIAATSAFLHYPFDAVVDAAGSVYIADTVNDRIRLVSAATGLISTVAGTGTAGYNGDGIAATTANLNLPFGVAVDGAGNVYIADYDNYRVRKVSAGTGLISTVAGTGVAGNNGDGIPATTAMLDHPSGVAVDAAGNIYIADYYDHRIRRVSAATGLISTVAGTGESGYNGDGMAATSARLYHPSAVAVDAAGNIYIADAWNERVRKVSAATGLISTVAGTGTWGYNGDGMNATAASLAGPWDVAVDAAANLYIADSENHSIRKVGILDAVLSVSSATAVGQRIAVTLTVVNTGLVSVTGLQPAIQVNAGSGQVAWLGGPDPAGPVTLAAGASRAFVWTYLVNGAGTVSLTATAVGTEGVTGGSEFAAGSATFVTTLGRPSVSGRLSPGQMVIAPNRLDPDADRATVFVYLRGTSGGTVELRIFDEAGLEVGSKTMTLDGQGYGVAEIARTVGGRELDPGVYWILASGGGVKGKSGFAVMRTRR